MRLLDWHRHLLALDIDEMPTADLIWHDHALDACEADMEAEGIRQLILATPEGMANCLARAEGYDQRGLTVFWPTSWPLRSDGFVAHRSTLNPEI